jgi:PAS domain S-box-containing protein
MSTHELTERKRADETLREGEQQYREIFDGTPDGVILHDANGVILDANDVTARNLETTRTALPGRSLAEFVTSANAAGIGAHAANALSGREQVFETTYVSASGKTTSAEVHEHRIQWKGREAVLSISRDITERKRVEKALRESEERFRIIFEHAADSILLLEIIPGGIPVIRDANSSTFSLLGYERGELIGQPVSIIEAAPDASKVVEERRQNILSKTGKTFESRHRCKNGTIRDFECSATELKIGSKTFGISVERDITERKRAEESLLESENRYRILFEDARDGIALADAETGVLVDCNRALCAMVEREKAELVGQTQAILHPPPNLVEGQSLTFRQHRGEHIEETLEDDLLSKSGNVIPTEIRATHIQIKGRKHLLGIFRDLTLRKHAEEERRNMQAQLIQAQKLEAMGTLAGGVAHEINNPINGIMNYARLMADKLPKQDPLHEYASEIMKETERVATIVRNLLQFARQEKQSRSPARMVDIVNAVLSLIRTILRNDQIAIEFNVPENLPKVKCRSQHIQQVIMNLLTNARDALNEKYPGTDKDKIVRVTAQETADHRWIRLTVEDHGIGITPDIAERIFNPFFTTKPKNKGTGLGLSISHTIIKDHGGDLTMECEPGKWTRFHMDLPVYEEKETEKT